MSLENPTRGFLNTLKKTELRNHCCELGIKGIWNCTKAQLIDLILEKCQSRNNEPIEVQEDSTNASTVLRKVLSEIKEVKEKLAIKEVEVEDLYEQLRLTNQKLKSANEDITELKEKVYRSLL